MEDYENTDTIGFSPGIAKTFLTKIEYLLSEFNKDYLNTNKRFPTNYRSFEKSLIEFREYLNTPNIASIPIYLLIKVENSTKNLLRSTSVNQKFRTELQKFLEYLEPITNNIGQDSIDNFSNIEPPVLKKVLKNELSKAERIYNNTLAEIKEIKDSSINEIKNINQDFISNIKFELNNLEQSSIDRMMTQSSKRLDELKKVQDGALINFKTSVQDSIDSITSQIEEEVQKFESKRIIMDALLEKVGLAKDAEVTIDQANKELRSANLFRWIGLGFMCFSIWLLAYLFRYYIGYSNVPKDMSLIPLKDLSPGFFVIRFMTVTLVSSPGIYLLKESASHRAKENLYRQRGTQLLTIRGYLSDLPDDQRTEVKKQLATNFFSFHNGKADTNNVPDFIKNMGEAVKIAKSLNPRFDDSEKRPNKKEPKKD